jgi:hypothetical protein
MVNLLGCGSATTTKETAISSTVAPPQATAPVAVEKKWVVTKIFEGSSRKITEPFSVSKNTRVNWEVDKDNNGFMLYLQNDKEEVVGGQIASIREGAGKDISYVAVKPGQYNLVIVASSKYKVVFEQQE